MEKTQAGSRRYPRNSERAQDDRTVKRWTVDGKLLLDSGKKGVYSSYTLYWSSLVSLRTSLLYFKSICHILVIRRFTHTWLGVFCIIMEKRIIFIKISCLQRNEIRNKACTQVQGQVIIC